ncbi:MAG: hypothetical protein N2554_05070, partial [Fimbriimonadales bacterium]|nr:hypothetical protein [Fimbriimonadales bacterium]
EVGTIFPDWRLRSTSSVHPYMFVGVPPDGKRVTLKFYDGFPPRPTGELRIQLPRVEQALQPQQPEPLPAVREVDGVRVRLDKVEWGCSRRMYHRTWQLEPLARPHLRVEPARDWVPLRAVVAPVGSGYREIFDSSSPRAAPLIGSPDLPVYQLVVWLKYRPTGHTKPVKFFIAPPPIEQFRKRRQYVDQISAAIIRADYENALALCNRARKEFPELAAFYRGYALALKGEYKRAIQAWQGLGKPRFEEPWRYDPRPAAALCYLLLGDRQSARATANAWRADWNLADRAWYEHTEITLSAASPETAISPAEAQRALNFFNPKSDPKNPDYQRRIRAARALAEQRYRAALRELQSLQIKRLVGPQDRLLMAYLYAKLGDAENARFLRQQVESELAPTEYYEWWNLRLLDRILFPREWRL